MNDTSYCAAFEELDDFVMKTYFHLVEKKASKNKSRRLEGWIQDLPIWANTTWNTLVTT